MSNYYYMKLHMEKKKSTKKANENGVFYKKII